MLNIVKAAAVAVVSLCAVSSYAATVTLVGTTVTYEYDDGQAALSLFGTPTLIGDVVRFLPPDFSAISSNGEGVVITTANFIFDNVYANNSGLALSTVLVQESGDYEITNGDGVTADLRLQLTSNTDGLAFPLVVSDSFDSTLGGSGGLQEWALSTVIDPEFEGQLSNSFAVSIQNTLTAFTDEAGESAWIQKKLAFVAVEEGGTLPPAIPIPAAAWLFGSALLGLMGVARKKRA